MRRIKIFSLKLVRNKEKIKTDIVVCRKVEFLFFFNLVRTKYIETFSFDCKKNATDVLD